jgi:hypothetical protein
LIIHPGYPKNNGSLWLNKTIQKTMFGITGVAGDKGPNTLHYFINRLLVFWLTRIMLSYISAKFLKALVSHLNSPFKKATVPMRPILPN